MRFLDRWVGSSMSAVLTIFRKSADVLRRKPAGPPRRILVVKLVEQGATVIAEPALRRATEMVGRDNVFMAVFAENRFILSILDVLPTNNIITIRSGNIFVIALDTIRAIWRMRREKIDTAVDFEFFSRFSGALTYLSGAKRRIGFHSFAGEAGYRGDLMTHRTPCTQARFIGCLLRPRRSMPTNCPRWTSSPIASRLKPCFNPRRLKPLRSRTC